MIQIGGVYTTFCHDEGILLQKYRDRNGRCIAILFKSIGVRGRLDSPDLQGILCQPNGPAEVQCEHVFSQISGLNFGR